MKLELANRWALVTGASSGIGAEFARQLAGRGAHLVLTARREERLVALRAQLFQEFGTICHLIPLDLGAPGAATELVRRVSELPVTVDLLVNNAGIGSVATISNTDPQRIHNIVQLNIAVLTELTYAYLPGLIERDGGGIINVASVAGFQPIAYMSVYAASKAYVLHFSEGLWAELQGTQVRLLALCPGTTETEFFDQAGAKNWLSRRKSHTPQQVVKAALVAYEKNRPVCIPGLANRLMTSIQRFVSRRRVVLETRKFFGPTARQNAR